MFLRKLSANRIAIVGLLVLGCVLPITVSPSAQSQSSSVSSVLPSQWTFNPPDRGIPGNREGGATRGCIQLTALVPDGGVATAMSYPTLMWHVSKANRYSDIELQVSLMDENEQEVYTTQYALDRTNNGEYISGIVRFDPPTQAGVIPLEPEKQYSWEVAPVCNGEVWSPSSVYGAIHVQSPNPDLVEKVKLATPQQRVALYAKAGLWPETLNSLYELGSLAPDDPQLNPELQEAWLKLLNSVGLERIVRQLDEIYEANSVRSATHQ